MKQRTERARASACSVRCFIGSRRLRQSEGWFISKSPLDGKMQMLCCYKIFPYNRRVDNTDLLIGTKIAIFSVISIKQRDHLEDNCYNKPYTALSWYQTHLFQIRTRSTKGSCRFSYAVWWRFFCSVCCFQPVLHRPAAQARAEELHQLPRPRPRLHQCPRFHRRRIRPIPIRTIPVRQGRL